MLEVDVVLLWVAALVVEELGAAAAVAVAPAVAAPAPPAPAVSAPAAPPAPVETDDYRWGHH